MAETLRADRPNFSHLDDLVNFPLVRLWLYWGMFWLLLTPSVGALIAVLFNFPDYLGTSPYLTFGRLRPLHVNGVIFGAFSTLFFGLCYYLVPRLCGVRVHREQLGFSLCWGWNLVLAAGLISMPLGWNQGLEAGELPLFADTGIFIVLAAYPLPRRIIHRMECGFGGRRVFAADLSPAIAANAYLNFAVKIERSGMMEFAWHEDGGAVYRAERPVVVV